MEGTPFIPEYQRDNSENQEKRAPKAETIGSLLVEANPEKDVSYRKNQPERLGKTLISGETLQNNTEYNPEKDVALRAKQTAKTSTRSSTWLGSLLSNKTDIGSTKSKPTSYQTQNSSRQFSSSLKQVTRVADRIMFSVILGLLLLIVLVFIFKR